MPFLLEKLIELYDPLSLCILVTEKAVMKSDRNDKQVNVFQMLITSFTAIMFSLKVNTTHIAKWQAEACFI